MTTKRTAPSLALALALILATSGPALAKKGMSPDSIPSVITVNAMTVNTDEGLTRITLQGDFPMNYITYQPDPSHLVLEVQDCDASKLEPVFAVDSPQVERVETATDESRPDQKVTRFTFTTPAGVSHMIQAEGNDLVLRFIASGTPDAPAAPTADPTATGTTTPAPTAPAAAPAPVVGPDGRINPRQTDRATYARQAALPASAQGRALTGVDTARAAAGQIVLLLDGPTAFSSFELADPPRLVVDFDGLTNQAPNASITVGSETVRRVRVSQFQTNPKPVARAVFDLAGPVGYELTPSTAGLAVGFSRATLPASSPEVETAAAPAPTAPTTAAPAATTPTTTAPAARPANPAPTDTAVQPPAEYAYYDQAQPTAKPPTPPAGVKKAAGLTFETKTIDDTTPVYTGRRISLELVDADIKQVFRLFHDISGLNFVLDPAINGKVTIVLDSVPWDQALDIILRNNGLDKIFDNNVMRISTTAKLATEAQSRRALKEASRLEVDPVTVSRVLSYAKSEDVDPIIRRLLSSRGQSFYDKRTNTVVVTDIPEKIDAVNRMMDDLDARTPQVMIEARIVETGREFTRELGIDWGFLANDQRGAGNSWSGSFDLNLPRVADTSRLGITFGDLGPNGFSIDLAIDALETEGRGRVLSAPKVAAQNNTTAIIEQGTQIPVVNSTATEINVEFISASLKLEVTPQITAEGTIIMDIKLDNSSPDFDNRVGGTPAINTERASTRVLVEDGGTTVIGGVFVMNEGESEVGIPGLRKIPGLGWLFKNKNITKNTRELLIFITPKIMS